jgi:hypothetical protein
MMVKNMMIHTFLVMLKKKNIYAIFNGWCS